MTAEDAERYNVLVVPMPVLINGKEYFENVDNTGGKSIYWENSMMKTSYIRYQEKVY